MGSRYYENKSKRYTQRLAHSQIGSDNIREYGNLHGYETNRGTGDSLLVEQIFDEVRKAYGG